MLAEIWRSKAETIVLLAVNKTALSTSGANMADVSCVKTVRGVIMAATFIPHGGDFLFMAET